MRKLLFVAGFFIILSCKSQVQIEDNNWRGLDSLVQKQLEGKHIPSISIGIVKDGKILLTKAYGYADLESKIPATENTVYQLGSVTKTLTGHVLANLVFEGKIGLEEKLSDFFPSELEFPEYSNKGVISVRDLATHSAEFPRYPVNLERVDPDPIKGYSYNQMLAGIEATKIDTIGGHRFNYSNFGYGILAMAMQNRTGTEFSKLLSQKVFQPYKMDNSSLTLNPELEKYLATPYLEVNPAIKTEAWDMGTLSGAGNIFSNVVDMSHFLMALMEENKINEIQQSRLLKINDNSWYGLGCFVIDSKKVNTTLIYHGGDVDGYSSSLKYYPEYDLGTVVLTNYGEGRIISGVFMDIEVFILEMLRDSL